MTKAEKLRFWGLIGFSVLIRLIFLSRPSEPVFDELGYLPYLQQFLSGKPEFIPHPPLGVAVLSWGVKLLGDSPLGWRIFPALLGALGVGLTYLLARRITKNSQSAFYAAFLLAFSFLWFTVSRIAMLDITLTVLLLGAVLAALKKRYCFAALLGGLALAVKWTALPALILLYAFIIREFLRSQEKNRLSYLQILFLPLLTAGIYLGVFALFYRNFHLSQLLVYQKVLWDFQTGLSPDKTYATPAWSWYLLPQAIPCFGENAPAFKQIVLMENPALLWWGVLSLIWAGLEILKKQKTFLTLPWLLWLSLYLPFFFTTHPGYLHYLIPTLPWLYLISGEALHKTFGDSFWSRVYLGFIALSFLAFYPWMVIK